MVQIGLGIKQDPISKISKAKQKGLAQVIEGLSCKLEALTPTPRTDKTGKKKSYYICFSNSTPRYIPKRINDVCSQKSCIWMITVALFTIAKK
jgi:hypothetical protein